jgi:hypothetical protein
MDTLYLDLMLIYLLDRKLRTRGYGVLFEPEVNILDIKDFV